MVTKSPTLAPGFAPSKTSADITGYSASGSPIYGGTGTLSSSTKTTTPAVNNTSSNSSISVNSPSATKSITSPTSVVSPAPALNQVTQAKQIVNAGGLTQTEADTRDAAATTDMKFLPGSGKPNPNYNDPNKNAPVNNTTSTSAEDAILNTPDTGNHFAYKPDGTRIEIPINTDVPDGYSVNKPVVVNTATLSTGSTIKQMGDGSYGLYGVDGTYIGASTPEQFNAITAGQTALKAFNDFMITGGTTLNSAQTAQLSGVKDQYAALIKKQETLNANTTGATTIAENMYGMGNTLTGQGVITDTVNQGIAKIADLTSKMNSDVANMTQGFEKDNLDLVKAGFDSYQTNSKNLQSSIDNFQSEVSKQQDKITQDQASINNAFAKKYPDTTTPILPTDTADQVVAKLQTSPGYLQDQKTKAGTVDQNVLDGMLKIYNKTGAIPAGMGNASVALKKAFYAALGGDTNLVDDATANATALSAAKGALKTQETQYEATKTSIGTLKSSMDRVGKYLQPLIDTGSPVLNGPLRDAAGKGMGSTTYSAFENEINTIATEYGKIITGASASIAGVSVQSVEDIKVALNTKITVAQLQTVLDAMRQDVNARLISQKGTIDQITSDVHDLGNTITSSSSSTSTPTSYNPSKPLSWDNIPIQ